MASMLSWLRKVTRAPEPTLPIPVVKDLYVNGYETGLLLGYEDVVGPTRLAGKTSPRSIAEGLRLGRGQSEKVLSLGVVGDDAFAEARRSGRLPVSVAKRIYASGFESGYATGVELGHLDAHGLPIPEGDLQRAKAKGERLGGARGPSDFEDALRRMGRTAGVSGGGGAGADDSDLYVEAPLSKAEVDQKVRWYGQKYGLKRAEALALLGDTSTSAAKVNERTERIEGALDAWRQGNGWPTASSPLSRGRLLSLIRRAS